MKLSSKITVVVFLFIQVMFFLPAASFSFGNSGTSGTLKEEKVFYRIPKVTGRIRVDGQLDEEIWKKALVIGLNYEIMPGENIEPPVRTEVLLAYTETHFYAAFRAFDPEPSAIRAVYADRDNFPDNDWVGLILDTFNDQRRTYNFYCNALGIQADAIQSPHGWVEWDPIWDSTGRITNQGYIVEMAIPFSSLRFQRETGDREQIWGFNAKRVYPRNVQHHINLFPWDRNNNCYMCQFKKIALLGGVKPGKNLELDPTLSTFFTQERDPFPEGELTKKKKNVDSGLTVRWGFTPNLTFSAAINPDFSHVEADAAQLDINTRFALYYPEKRPFFLEGAGIFTTPMAAVYTRSLADPNWGIKITGKEGPHSLGFYFVRDNVTNLLFPGSHQSDSTLLDRKTSGSVLRYRLDIGKASTVGLLLTDREGSDYFNRLAGFDAYLRLSHKKHVTLQLMASQTRYPDMVAVEYAQPKNKFSGTAMDFLFKHESRNFGYYFSYQQITPHFRADLGFMPQVGYQNVSGGLVFASWRNPGHWYTYIDIAPSVEYEVDHHDDLIYKNLKLTANYEGPSQTNITLEGRLGEQSFMGNIFETNQVEARFNIQPSGALQVWLNAVTGEQIDFANIRQGKRILVNPGILYKVGRHFSVNMDHIFEHFNVEAGHLYTANVSNLKMVYQFSRRIFLRTIIQYINYRYNIENYSFSLDPEFKHLFTQVLFSYKINPQTVLFLGYSDDHYGYLHTPLTQANRTFFLKIGYALVL